jgi:cation diffusion facilitator CzcD-associated flavoprotein CzcO
MACRLKRDYNLDNYHIYDRQAGLGGTWLANICLSHIHISSDKDTPDNVPLDPGCAVDIPGFCYSYSFAPNPDFTQMFPPQAEILGYITNVVKQYHVDQHFTGNVEWTGAAWSDKSQTWSVSFQDVQTKQAFMQECQILISAVGGLVNPQELKIPGAETFQGEIIHTARWKKGVDLTNKHVAVIGNGGMHSAARITIPAN